MDFMKRSVKYLFFVNHMYAVKQFSVYLGKEEKWQWAICELKESTLIDDLTHWKELDFPNLLSMTRCSALKLKRRRSRNLYMSLDYLNNCLFFGLNRYLTYVNVYQDLYFYFHLQRSGKAHWSRRVPSSMWRRAGKWTRWRRCRRGSQTWPWAPAPTATNLWQGRHARPRSPTHEQTVGEILISFRQREYMYHSQTQRSTLRSLNCCHRCTCARGLLAPRCPTPTRTVT